MLIIIPFDSRRIVTNLTSSSSSKARTATAATTAISATSAKAKATTATSAKAKATTTAGVATSTAAKAAATTKRKPTEEPTENPPTYFFPMPSVRGWKTPQHPSTTPCQIQRVQGSIE